MAKKVTKILHIEDDLSVQELVQEVLSGFNYQLYGASTGLEGLKLAQKVNPDLILMDLNLPDINGTELTAKIKSLPKLQHVVIVALTGVSEEQARELSLIAGCDGYITKPIDLTQFPKKIEAFLRGEREVVSTEKKEAIRKHFEVTLIDHLTEKVEQLQKSNQLLKKQSKQLRRYNRNLENLLQVIHSLQLSSSPEALRHQLLKELNDQFGYQRSAFLEVDHEQMVLRVTETYGYQEEVWKDIRIKYRAPYYLNMFKEHQLLAFRSLRQITDQETKKILKQLKATKFLFGILGATQQEVETQTTPDNLRQLFGELTPTLHNQEELDFEIIQEHLQEYLSSEIFYVGGYIFIDISSLKASVQPYDLKILEMLLRTAGIIYQNLRLREQLKELFIRAEKDAITDHLTNLFNYRYFSEQLVRECNRAHRHNSRFTLLMLDIDFFKSYNDTFGHQAGDLVLKRIGDLLRENTRGSDFVARYGGEEFVIICPELSKKEGKQLAEKLCHIVGSTPFPLEEKLPHKKITISIGVAGFPDDTQSPQELIRFADIALYKAKNSGRNQVQIYCPSDS